MQTPQIMRPPVLKVFWHFTIDFLHQPCARNSDQTLRLYKTGEVIQVEIICPIVDEGIDADDRVEEIRGERQFPRIRVDWIDAVLDACVADSLEVLRGAEPKISRPNLHAVFPVQEDRRGRPPTAKIQHSHARP